MEHSFSTFILAAVSFGEQWDYVVFCLLCLLAAGAIHRWLHCAAKKREDPVDRQAMAGMWAALALVLAPGWFVAEYFGNGENARLRARIEGLAPTYAEELTEMGHASITVDTPPDDPIYLAMIQQQIRWLELNRAVADIYTFRKSPEGNALIVDSETDYNHDGKYEGDREKRTKIGEIWEETSATITAARDGTPGFDERPYTDRWGTWVSAYVPMYDEEGKVEAVLGVDFPAEEWVDSIRRARWVAFGLLGILVSLVLASGAIIEVLRASLLERRRSERALRKAKEKADAANEALEISNRDLEQFAYTASHDLREPLRMVTSFLQLLKKRYEGKLGEDGEEYIRHAVEGGERMRRLINGLLELSRLNRKGKKFGPVDTAQVVSVALDNLSVVIRETGARITKSNLPKVMGDKTQLIQLFQNLVSNAIRFCESGKPRIDISAHRVQQDKSAWWVFSVRDNGPGIAPEHHERIYEIFRRLQPDSKGGGTGIGLSLCRKIVENHGGEITVESAPGQGSDFRFNLLAAEETEESPQA